MCNVSMIMDTWRPHIPHRDWGPMTTPLPTVIPAPAPSGRSYTIEELTELLAAFHKAVEAAETFDKLTGQPDCVDPEKAELLGRVAELEQRLAALEGAA